MKLEFRPRALDDLIKIRDQLTKQADAPVAERVRQHIAGRLNRLKRQPTLGIPTSNSAIRILSPTKYRIASISR